MTDEQKKARIHCLIGGHKFGRAKVSILGANLNRYSHIQSVCKHCGQAISTRHFTDDFGGRRSAILARHRIVKKDAEFYFPDIEARRWEREILGRE